MRRKNWPAKKIYYQDLKKNLKKHFGYEEIKEPKAYIKRYVELNDIVYPIKLKEDAILELSYLEMKKVSTAESAVKEIPIEIYYKFDHAEAIFFEILAITQSNTNYELAYSIITEEELEVSQDLYDAAIC